MSVYDYEGNDVTTCFDVDSNSLIEAFSVSGEKVFQRGTIFNVMTFNIQHWSGLNANTTLVGGIFSRNNPLVVGLQECLGGGTGGYVPDPFPYGQVATGATNPSGIMSKVPFENFTSITFHDLVGESKGYSKCYITIEGKRIAWFNAHLEYYNEFGDNKYPVHVSQMKEIFDAVQTENTFILTGDFNVMCKSKSEQPYTDTVKQFVDAGYNMCNWTDETGFVDTWFNGATVGGSSEKYPHDNIITSSDIEILAINYDIAKLTAGGTIDHIPIIATISIPEL